MREDELKSALAARICTPTDAIIIVADVEDTVVVTHGYAATFADGAATTTASKVVTT